MPTAQSSSASRPKKISPKTRSPELIYSESWKKKRLNWAAKTTTRRGNSSAIFSKVARQKNLGKVAPSYTPGIHLTDLSEALPKFAIDAIREAIPAFDKQIKGFAMHDALLTGIETRTSSPIRIKRGADGQSFNTSGLYPAGEGAGYAGGILSAGIDGIKAAESVALDILRENN